jgi:SET domain-containing protein
MKYLKMFENFDYDKIDIPEEDYLYIQPSQITNAGNGLFTSIDIEKGEIISKFIGEIISNKEAWRRYDLKEDDYFMTLPSGETLDCKRTDCFAKLANDAEGIPSKFNNNSKIIIDNEENVVLVAIRDIKAGEEIFTGYGRRYWQRNKYRVI